MTGPDGFGYRRNLAWKKSPPELVERFDELLPALPGVERRKMFGFPASFVHGNMFAGLHDDRFVLRLGEEHVAEARRTGARAFEPVPGRPMNCWCVVPPEVVANDTGLRKVSSALTITPRPRRRRRGRSRKLAGQRRGRERYQVHILAVAS